MTIELWTALAVVLLAVAAGARGLALSRGGGRWVPIAIGARVGAALVLAMGVVLEGGTRGGWSPWDLAQVALGLALATLAVDLVLVWWLGVDAAAPAVDLVALLLVLTGILTGYPGRPLLALAPSTTPFHIQWALFLLGSGALMVAGSTGLMLALRAGLTRRVWKPWISRWLDFHALLKQATAWALVALGGGLAVGMWWAWRTVGTLTSGDPREGWVFVAWLVAAMSMLARRIEKRWGRWTAGLAVLAAAIAAFGLLVSKELWRFLGM